MSKSIPLSMRALVLSKYSKPSEYNVATIPTPEISKSDELLVKIHAAAVNPIDVGMATGFGKYVEVATFPYKLGFDLAGIVVAIGNKVTNFKLGDEVYSRAPNRGSIAEYALTTESHTAMKPKSLSFSEAASIPLAAQTALQSLQRADHRISGGLNGKTVFIPGGLSGTGSFAVQLAKTVFGAGKVITTVSTGKLSMIKELLGDNAPDQIIDYVREDVQQAVGEGRVDFMFDIMKGTLSSLPLMKKGGVIVSVSAVPPGKMTKKNYPDARFWLIPIMDFADWIFRTWSAWKGVDYSFLGIDCNTRDLENLARWVDEGKVKPILGKQIKLSDIDEVRSSCQRILDGNGGVGKLVINID